MRKSAQTRHFAENQNKSAQGLRINGRLSSDLNFRVNLSEINSLRKNAQRSQRITLDRKASPSLPSRHIQLKVPLKSASRAASPGIYRPFKVSCHSFTLKIKYSKPKISHLVNSFIVKQLKRPH